jgi:GxxExxY protein
MEGLTEQIIASAIEVHRHLGPGLLESTYEECLAREFELAELPFQRQVSLPVSYKGKMLDCGYRMDFVVDDKIILELKAVERFEPIHQAQLLTYLKLARKRLGLLINFNVPLLKQGIKRIANNYQTSASSAPLR